MPNENKDILSVLHQVASSEKYGSYQGSLEDFSSKVTTDEDFLRHYHQVAIKEGYRHGIDKFKESLGFQDPKKKSGDFLSLASTQNLGGFPSRSERQRITPSSSDLQAPSLAEQGDRTALPIQPPVTDLSITAEGAASEANQTSLEIMRLNADIFAAEKSIDQYEIGSEERDAASNRLMELKEQQKQLAERKDELVAEAIKEQKNIPTGSNLDQVLQQSKELSKMYRGEIEFAQSELNILQSKQKEAERASIILNAINTGSIDQVPEGMTREEMLDMISPSQESINQINEGKKRIQAMEKKLRQDTEAFEALSDSEQQKARPRIEAQYNQYQQAVNQYNDMLENNEAYQMVMELTKQVDDFNEALQGSEDINERLKNSINSYISVASPTIESSISGEQLATLFGEFATPLVSGNPLKALALSSLSKDPLFIAKNTQVSFPELAPILGSDFSMSMEALAEMRGFDINTGKPVGEMLTGWETMVNSFKNLKATIPSAFSGALSGYATFAELVLEESAKSMQSGGGAFLASYLAAKLQDPITDVRKKEQLFQKMYEQSIRPTQEFSEIKGLMGALSYAFDGASGFFPSMAVAATSGALAPSSLMAMFTGTHQSSQEYAMAQAAYEERYMRENGVERDQVPPMTLRDYAVEIENVDGDKMLSATTGGLLGAMENYVLKRMRVLFSRKAVEGGLGDVIKNVAIIEAPINSAFNNIEVATHMAIENYAYTKDFDAATDEFLKMFTTKEGAEVFLKTYVGTLLMGGFGAAKGRLFMDRKAASYQFTIDDITERIEKQSSKLDGLQGEELADAKKELQVLAKARIAATSSLYTYLQEKGAAIPPDIKLSNVNEIWEIAELNERASILAGDVMDAQSIQDKNVRERVIAEYQQQFNALSKQREDAIKRLEEQRFDEATRRIEERAKIDRAEAAQAQEADQIKQTIKAEEAQALQQAETEQAMDAEQIKEQMEEVEQMEQAEEAKKETIEEDAETKQASDDVVQAERQEVTDVAKKQTQKVTTLPVSEVSQDPARFQYKSDVDPESGVSEKLKGRKFKPELSSVISVWVDPVDGKTYVINGHHRLDLAKSTGQESIDVKYVQAESAEEARTIGAMQNIAEGQGSDIDAAKIFRQGDLTTENLKDYGLSISDSKTRRGLALANLSDSLFDLVVSGKLDIAKGVIIGENISSKDIQEQFYNIIKGKNLTNATIEVMAQDIQSTPKKTEVVTDLFGTTEKEMADYEKRASLVAGVREVIGRAKNLLGKTAKGKEFLEEYGNKIDQAKSEGASSKAAEALGVFDVLRNTSPEISAIINEAFEKLQQGKNKKTVINEAARQIIEITPQILGRKDGADAKASPRAETSERGDAKQEVARSKNIKKLLSDKIEVDSPDRRGIAKISDVEKFIGEDRLGDAAMPDSRQRIDELKKSISEEGFKEPIVVMYDRFSGDGEAAIVEGNHRIAAAKELGLTEIPVTFEKGKLRSNEKRIADGMFPLQRVSVGEINDARGVRASQLGIDIRMPNDADFGKQEVATKQEAQERVDDTKAKLEEVKVKLKKNIDNEGTSKAEGGREVVEKKYVKTEPATNKKRGGSQIINVDSIKESLPNLYKVLSGYKDFESFGRGEIENLRVSLYRKLMKYKSGAENVLSKIKEIETVLEEFEQSFQKVSKEDFKNQMRDSGDFNQNQLDILFEMVDSINSEFMPEYNSNKESLQIAGLKPINNFYAAAKNIISSKNPESFIHEIGHFAFYKILTSADRIAFMEYAISSTYGKDGKSISERLAATSEKVTKTVDGETYTLSTNTASNFDEYFAEQFRQWYMGEKMSSKKIETLFEKVLDYMRSVVDKIVSKKYIDKNLVPFFEKIINEAPNKGKQEVAPKQEQQPSEKQSQERVEQAKAKLKESFDKMKRLGIAFDGMNEAKETIEFIRNLAEYLQAVGVKTIEEAREVVKGVISKKAADFHLPIAMRRIEGKPTPRERLVEKAVDKFEEAKISEGKDKVAAVREAANAMSKLGKYTKEQFKKDAKSVGMAIEDKNLTAQYKKALGGEQYAKQTLSQKIENLKGQFKADKESRILLAKERREFTKKVDALLEEFKEAGGKMKTSKAASIAQQAAAVTTEKKLEDFSERLSREVLNLEQESKMSEARKLAKDIAKALRKGKVNENYKGIVQNFLSVKPTQVFDIDAYVEAAKKIATTINDANAMQDKSTIAEMKAMVEMLGVESKTYNIERLSKQLDITPEKAEEYLNEYGQLTAENYEEKRIREWINRNKEDLSHLNEDEKVEFAREQIEKSMREAKDARNEQALAERNQLEQDVSDLIEQSINEGLIDEVFNHLQVDKRDMEGLLALKGLLESMIMNPEAKKFGINMFKAIAEADRRFNAHSKKFRVIEYTGRTSKPMYTGLDLTMYLRGIVANPNTAPELSAMLNIPELRKKVNEAQRLVNELVTVPHNNLVKNIEKKYKVNVLEINNTVLAQVYSILRQKEDGLTEAEHIEKRVDELKKQSGRVKSSQSPNSKILKESQALEDLMKNIEAKNTIKETLAQIEESNLWVKEYVDSWTSMHDKIAPQIEQYTIETLGYEPKMVTENYNTIQTLSLASELKEAEDLINNPTGLRHSAAIYGKRINAKKSPTIHFERVENRNMKDRIYDMNFHGTQIKSLSNVITEINTAGAVMSFSNQIASERFLNESLNGNQKIHRDILKLARDYYNDSVLDPKEMDKLGVKFFVNASRIISNRATEALLYSVRSVFTQALPQIVLNTYALAMTPIVASKESDVSGGDILMAGLKASYMFSTNKQWRQKMNNLTGKDMRSYRDVMLEAREQKFSTKNAKTAAEKRKNEAIRAIMKASKFGEKISNDVFSKLVTLPDGVTVAQGAIMLAAMEAARKGNKDVLNNIESWTPSETEIEAAHQRTRDFYSADVSRELAPDFKPSTVGRMVILSALGFLSKYPASKVLGVSRSAKQLLDVRRDEKATEEEKKQAAIDFTITFGNMLTEGTAYGATINYVWPYVLSSIIEPSLKATVIPMFNKLVELMHSGEFDEYEEEKSKINDALESYIKDKMFAGKTIEAVLPFGIGYGINELSNGLNYTYYKNFSRSKNINLTYAEWRAANMHPLQSFNTERSGAKGKYNFLPGAYDVWSRGVIGAADLMWNASKKEWTSPSGITYQTDEQGAIVAQLIGMADMMALIAPVTNLGGLTPITSKMIKKNERKRLGRSAYDIAYRTGNQEKAMRILQENMAAAQSRKEMQALASSFEKSLEKIATREEFAKMLISAQNEAEKVLSISAADIDISDFTLTDNEYISFNDLDEAIMRVAARKGTGRRLTDGQIQAAKFDEILSSDAFQKMFSKSDKPTSIEQLKIFTATYAKMKAMGVPSADAFFEQYAMIATMNEARRQGYKGGVEGIYDWIENKEDFYEESANYSLIPEMYGVKFLKEFRGSKERVLERIEDKLK